jgi:hypothetical protein
MNDSTPGSIKSTPRSIRLAAAWPLVTARRRSVLLARQFIALSVQGLRRHRGIFRIERDSLNALSLLRAQRLGGNRGICDIERDRLQGLLSRHLIALGAQGRARNLLDLLADGRLLDGRRRLHGWMESRNGACADDRRGHSTNGERASQRGCVGWARQAKNHRVAFDIDHDVARDRVSFDVVVTRRELDRGTIAEKFRQLAPILWPRFCIQRLPINGGDCESERFHG